MNKIEVFKETQDDWFGAYKVENSPRLLARVQVSQLTPASNEWFRVGVWGNDDYGLIKDFYNSDDALAIFRTIVGMSFVSKNAILNLGFTQF